MSRFKQVWVSFFRQSRGFGMIEAAIMLPLFLLITFGVMEFGNMYMNRYQVHDVAGAVADYLQANPGATMDTPNGGLKAFVENLGVGLKNTTSGGENQISSKIKIKSATSIKTEAQFNALCSGGDVQSWGNPHLLDADVTNDQNPYYIHVCYPYTYNNITPLSGLSGGLLSGTKTLKGKAIAYVNTNNGGGGGNNGNDGKNGNDGNTPTIANITCSEGEFLAGISNGNAFCKSVVAGGGGGECSRIPGARLSDGSVVADRCSPMVTTADSYFILSDTGEALAYPNILYPLFLAYVNTLSKHPPMDFSNYINELDNIWMKPPTGVPFHIVDHANFPHLLSNSANAWAMLGGQTDWSNGEDLAGPEKASEILWSGAKFCENLTAHGRSDWVLPTVAELYIMYNNRKAIGGFIPQLRTTGHQTDKFASVALFSADSRNTLTTQDRVSDAMVSFGAETTDFLWISPGARKPLLVQGGQVVSRPENWMNNFNPGYWNKSLGETGADFSDTFHTYVGPKFQGSFGVRCVRQSDQ